MITNVRMAVFQSMRNITERHRKLPNRDSQGLKYLKEGLQPGDFVMLAWNDEKLMRAYEATKKLERMLETTFRSAIKIQIRARKNTKMYPLTGSLFAPYPFANNSIPGNSLSLARACSTLGAPTKLAIADDNVAAKQPP